MVATPACCEICVKASHPAIALKRATLGRHLQRSASSHQTTSLQQRAIQSIGNVTERIRITRIVSDGFEVVGAFLQRDEGQFARRLCGEEPSVWRRAIVRRVLVAKNSGRPHPRPFARLLTQL